MSGFTHLVLRRVRGEEGGFTLIEVLVTVSLLAVVLGAALALSHTSGQVANKDIERAHSIEEVQNGIARMDRELRAATQLLTPASGASSNSIEFLMRVRPAGGGLRVSRRVRYQCDVTSPSEPTRRACYRYEGDPAASPGGTGTLVVDGVVNGTSTEPVFGANTTAPPTFLSIHLRRSAAGRLKNGYDYAIKLEHGVHLRNVSGTL
jgi:prepilin-type N-terminal cleavage/methylation domain-containing protein